MHCGLGLVGRCGPQSHFCVRRCPLNNISTLSSHTRFCAYWHTRRARFTFTLCVRHSCLRSILPSQTCGRADAYLVGKAVCEGSVPLHTPTVLRICDGTALRAFFVQTDLLVRPTLHGENYLTTGGKPCLRGAWFSNIGCLLVAILRFPRSTLLLFVGWQKFCSEPSVAWSTHQVVFFWDACSGLHTGEFAQGSRADSVHYRC